MRTLGTLLSIIVLTGFCGARCKATVYNSNGSSADVQRIHDTQAHDGDTITLPAGTFTWSSTVTITKGTTIQGLTTTDSVNGTASDQTIIIDNITRIPGGAPIVVLSTSLGRSYRVTGLTFRAGGLAVAFNGGLLISGNSHAVRIDHCHLDDLRSQNDNIAIWGDVYGVIDHNVADYTTYTRFFFSNGSYPGDAVWASPADWGTEKFMFLEDNYINNRTYTNEFAGGTDDLSGARWVLRYNHCFNISIQNHGTEIGRYRGGYAREVYNNDFHFVVTRIAGGIRSGSVIMHDNTYFGAVPNQGLGLQAYRSFFNALSAPWGPSGDTPWDYNVTEPNGTHIDGHPPYLFASGTCSSGSNETTIVDTSKNWIPNKWIGYTAKRVSDNGIMLVLSNTSNTLSGYRYSDSGGGPIWAAGNQYQIHKVLRILDAPGSGQGDLITGDPPINTVTGTASHPRNVLEPCYSWNNVHSPSGAHINMWSTSFNPPGLFIEGRDFINDTPKPGYTTYVYPHPLVGGQPTPTPTPTVTPTAISLRVQKDRVNGINTSHLRWTGATSPNVAVYRNSARIVATANDGQYDDSTGDTGQATYIYQVCEPGAQNCSDDVTVTFPP